MTKFRKKIALLLTGAMVLSIIPSLAYTNTQETTSNNYYVTNSTNFSKRMNYIKKDLTAPVITLNGSSYISIAMGASYTDAGATALDNISGRVPVNTTSNVNTRVQGKYTVKYTASDAAGNIAYAYRTVEVKAPTLTTPPPVVSQPTAPVYPSTSVTNTTSTTTSTSTAGQSSTEVTSATDATMKKVYLSSFSNISGSLKEYTGSISGGSGVLTLSTSAHDYKVGHGIAIKGAGNNKETNYWLITTVKAVDGNKLTLSTNASASVSGALVLHDDTKAVNSAIATGNAIYYFDIPQMNIKGLNLKSNAVYDGMGTAVLTLPVIYSSVPWVQSMISAEDQTNVTFRNFTLDGGKTRGVYANDQVGVSLMLVLDSTKTKIQNNTFRNNGYISINLQSKVNDILIEDNTILNTDIGIMAMPEWLGNLYLENAVFQNNYMDGGTSEGISIVSGMRENVGYAKNITIHQNVIKNKLANGIQYGSRTSNIVISENEITKCNNGISSIDPNLEKRDNMTSTNADIIKNKVYNNKWSNFVLDGTDVFVANNEISDGNNVLVLGRLFIDTVTVESNKFINTSVALSPAIHIYNLKNGTIKNNVFVIGSTNNFNAAIGTENGNISNLTFTGNDLGGMRVLDLYKATTLVVLDQKY